MNNAMTHTVLIVEDEKELREMMQDALELNGYAVISAADGQSALEAIDGVERVCLVLLDLVMPGMNGWDLCSALRARPDLAELPIVVHSSSPADPPTGATRILRKPVDLKQLMHVVRQYCAA